MVPRHYVSQNLDNQRSSFLADGMLIVLLLALANFLLHLYFNHRYGYFRDEFNYMACGDHLAWRYVDHPPLIPFLIKLSRLLLGDSLRSIRFIPALASSLLIVQTAAIARKLGGRRYALLLSAICALIAPQYLSNGSLLGTNCLEPNLWMGCAYFAILAIQRNDPRYWLWFGVVAGIGLEEKYSIALFGLGIVVGLLLTEQRRVFLNKWIWLGGFAALLIFLPNVLWNIKYDWPFLQLIRAIRAEGRDVVLGPFPYFFQQTLLVNPLTAPIWLVGFFALLFSMRLKPYRALGWCYVVCYTAFFVLLLLASGAHLAPVVVPVLSPDGFLAYTKYLPFKLPVMEHSHARAALPQWYSDQFGWKEIADEAAVAWNRIPAVERPGCGIFTQNYGQAGAIDFFGRRYGLPPALSGHQTYFLWGPRGYSGNCMIVLDDRREVLEREFEHVEYVGKSADNRYAMEREIPVFICRGAKFGSLAEVWPRLKRWR